MKAKHFTYLHDKICSKIASQNNCKLPQPGKLIIINSILVASVNHVLSIFKLPAMICNRIDAMIARFFWAANDLKGIHWCKRQQLHHPKGMGGIGVEHIAFFNQALIMKRSGGFTKIHNYY